MTWLSNLPYVQFPSFFQSEDLSSPPVSGTYTENLPSYDVTANAPVDLFQQSGFDDHTGNNFTVPATIDGVPHEYRRLPGTEDETLEEWLKISEGTKVDRKEFQCI